MYTLTISSYNVIVLLTTVIILDKNHFFIEERGTRQIKSVEKIGYSYIERRKGYRMKTRSNIGVKDVECI